MTRRMIAYPWPAIRPLLVPVHRQRVEVRLGSQGGAWIGAVFNEEENAFYVKIGEHWHPLLPGDVDAWRRRVPPPREDGFPPPVALEHQIGAYLDRFGLRGCGPEP